MNSRIKELKCQIATLEELAMEMRDQGFSARRIQSIINLRKKELASLIKNV